MAGYCFRKADGTIVEAWEDHKTIQSKLDGAGNLILAGDKRAIRDKDEEIKRGYARDKTEVAVEKVKEAEAAKAALAKELASEKAREEPEDKFPAEELEKIDEELLAPEGALVEEPKEED